ncbi:MAG: 3'-5' exonuclease [Halanaerobiaceae bacterium]|nr:3'-5' exonuclease [Halanaerobiaceae bacterium]
MSRESAIEKRKRWLENKQKYCLVDTETTGLGNNDRVVEIAIIDLDGKVLLNTLVNPGISIPPEAERIHGISDSMVKDAPSIGSVGEKIRENLNDRIMIAYNAEFDARMIRQTFNIDVNYECLMYNVMDFHNSDRYMSLEKATAHLRKEDQEHRALGDCYLCLKLIKHSLETGRG